MRKGEAIDCRGGGGGVLCYRQQTRQLCFPTFKKMAQIFEAKLFRLSLKPARSRSTTPRQQQFCSNRAIYHTQQIDAGPGRALLGTGYVVKPAKHIMKYEGSLCVRRVSHRHNCYRRDYSKTVSLIFPRAFMSHTRQQGGQSYVSDSDTRSTQLCVRIVPRHFNFHEDYSKKRSLIFVRARSRVLRRAIYVSYIHHNATEKSTHSSTRGSPSATPTLKRQVAQVNWICSQAHSFAQRVIKLVCTYFLPLVYCVRVKYPQECTYRYARNTRALNHQEYRRNGDRFSCALLTAVP